MKPAFLVIDVQKMFFGFSPVIAQSLNEAIEYINEAIAVFREKELPVVCVLHKDEANKLVPGQERFEVPESLDIRDSDLHIHKSYGNAFNKTELAGELRDIEVDTVIITGYCAEHCVLSTYRGAQDHDLTPVILRGGLASGRPEIIPFVESIGEVISCKALNKLLD